MKHLIKEHDSKDLSPSKKFTFKKTMERRMDMAAFPDYKFIFVLTPFASEHEEIYKSYIKRPLENKGYKVAKADTIMGTLREDILQRICHQIRMAGIIVVNTTEANPNVMFEYGVAYTMEKEIIPICEDAKALPADIKHLPHIEYKNDKTNFALRLVAEIDEIKKRREDSGEEQFGEFWNAFCGDLANNDDILVVLSAKGKGHEHADLSESPKPGHTVKVSYNELTAFGHLQNSLFPIRNCLKVIHSDLSNLDYREDGKLIIIGSPHASRICSRIISACKSPRLPYNFKTSSRGTERHKYIETNDGKFPSDKKSKDTSISGKNLQQDYGVILRVINPLSGLANNKVLILAGNHGYGTESAVRMVSDYRQVKFLHEKVNENDFASLFKIHVGAGTGLSLNFLQISILKEGKWETVYDKIEKGE